MAERDRPHIIVTRSGAAEPYGPPPRRIDGVHLVGPQDRRGHGVRLVEQLQVTETEGLARREGLEVLVEGSVDGIYVVFESFPGVELALESLDPRQGRLHPELVTVREVETAEGIREYATVFVPDGTLGYFLRRLQTYVDTADEEKGSNRNLIDRIRSVGLASLEELWTDPPSEFPEPGELAWWELWLRRRDGHERERLSVYAEAVGARLGRTSLGFADRTVVLVEATAAQLASALNVLDDLAELRRPRAPASLLALELATDQADWVAQLAGRTRVAPDGAPAVCVVDTGVHQAHPLLESSLSPNDCHACDPNWGVGDHDGHGTEMAGLALYGNVGESILAAGEIRLRHRLESVKLLPPPPAANPPELYGAVTATAASLVEIQEPERRRVFSLATTSEWQTPPDGATQRFGEPSSWSAAIDALAAGVEIDITDEGLIFLNEAEVAAHRLFLIAAGNVDVGDEDHLARSDIEPVEDPGQSWNALTVGAYTDLDDLGNAPSLADNASKASAKHWKPSSASWRSMGMLLCWKP